MEVQQENTALVWKTTSLCLNDNDTTCALLEGVKTDSRWSAQKNDQRMVSESLIAFAFLWVKGYSDTEFHVLTKQHGKVLQIHSNSISLLCLEQKMRPATSNFQQPAAKPESLRSLCDLNPLPETHHAGETHLTTVIRVTTHWWVSPYKHKKVTCISIGHQRS